MPKSLPTWDTHDVDTLRDFSRICLIAVDLDGTLVQPSASELYRKLENLTRSLAHHKVALTIATGRALAGVRPLLDSLQLPRGLPLILYNGSVVVQNRSFNVVFQSTISARGLQEVLDVCRPYAVRAYAYVYDDPRGSIFRPMAANEYVLGWSRTKGPKYELNGLRVEWQSGYRVRQSVNPCAVVIETPTDIRIASLLEVDLAGLNCISCTHGSPYYMEVRPSRSHKGVALAEAAKFLRVSPEHVLALGDSDNDSEMLSWAGIGVAIAKASPSALAASEYVCHYGVAAGAIEVLRLVREARRYFYQRRERAAGREAEEYRGRLA